ncbi:hypothetical protein NE865_12321 [Phthorimaea operculella]|nr:hypothetical protein NE865_12321 [Phthorimaea operculella]
MNLKVYLQNSRSMRGKLIDFTQGLLLHDFDIISICETWLHDSIGDSEVCDSRYSVHRRDRPFEGSLARRGGRGGVRSIGGGVMLLVRRELGARTLPPPDNALYDMIHIIIDAKALRSCRDLHIICAYLPGDGRSHDAHIVHLTQYCNDFISNQPPADYLLLGDFNLTDIKWERNPDTELLVPVGVTNEKHISFIETIALLGFEQYNFIPNDNGRFLDLIFCTVDVVAGRCSQPITREDMPHHPALEFELPNIGLVSLKDPKHRIYNFKKADYDAIRKRLSSIDWHSLLATGDVNDAVKNFNNQLNTIIADEVPSFISNGSGYPVWFSKSLIKIIQEKTKFHTRWKRFGNPLDYDSFSILRDRHKAMQAECWAKYVDNTEDSIVTNPREFWKFSNSLRRIVGFPLKYRMGTMWLMGVLTFVIPF